MVRNALCVLGVSAAAVLLAVANCASADFYWSGDGFGVFGDQNTQSGATIEVAAGAPAAAGAAAIEFRLFACAAQADPESATVPVQAAQLREFAGFGDLPLETRVDHTYSDHVFEVDSGCYQVLAQPVDASGRPIEGCSAAKTPDTYIDAAHSQRYAMLADCDAQNGDLRQGNAQEDSTDAVTVDGRTNHSPRVAELSVERRTLDRRCESVEICATARDRDDDALTMHWSLSSGEAANLRLPAPTRSSGAGHLTECVQFEPGQFEPGQSQWKLEVTAKDLREDGDGEPVTFEDAYLGEHGLVSRSADSRSIEFETACDADTCPQDPGERISGLTYWITRDGKLLEPTDDLGEVQPGDMVDVEFELAQGCRDTQLTFASYTTSKPENPQREEQASVFTRTYDGGTHLLWNVLPDCPFVVDLHLGGALGAAERTADADPYGGRLIDSASGGEGDCSSSAAQ